jgi:hypothetical protein
MFQKKSSNKKNHLNHIEFTHFTIFNPLKNFAMSWSDDCHGRPRALTTVLPSTTSFLLLFLKKFSLILIAFN